MWLQRRIIVTKEIIALAQPEEEKMLDHIPLAQVDLIQIMETGHEEIKNLSKSQREIQEREESDIAGCSFSIKCVPDGHNKGRIYYFRSDSRESTLAVVGYLKKAVLSAKFRSEAHSHFARSQYFVRKIYTSAPFHYTSAALIIGVRKILSHCNYCPFRPSPS
jgi:hypothetical protein